MEIYFYKGILPEIWKSEVSNDILLNAAKFQGYSLYRFWFIMRKPAVGRGATITPTHTPILWLSGKFSQKLVDHAKQSATGALKTTSK